jgi:hypothetical protein
MRTVIMLRAGWPGKRGSIAGWSERFASSPKHLDRLWGPHVLRLGLNTVTTTAMARSIPGIYDNTNL